MGPHDIGVGIATESSNEWYTAKLFEIFEMVFPWKAGFFLSDKNGHIFCAIIIWSVLKWYSLEIELVSPTENATGLTNLFTDYE